MKDEGQLFIRNIQNTLLYKLNRMIVYQNVEFSEAADGFLYAFFCKGRVIQIPFD